MTDVNVIELTAEIVSAHVSNNQVASADLPALIQTVFAALDRTTKPAEVEPVKQAPAVSIRTSVKPDHLVCLEDGAKVTMLKRYLRSRFGLSPEDYRAKWGLPRDYPMVAPNYAERRRALAQTIGLGRKRIADAATAVVDEVKHGAEAAVAATGLGAPAETKPKAARTPRASAKPAAALQTAAPKKAARTKVETSDTTPAPKKRGRPAKAVAAEPTV